MYYSSFGLIFKSEDLHLPELDEIKSKTDIYDVLIKLDDHKKWPNIEEGKYDTEFLKMAKIDTLIFLIIR